MRESDAADAGASIEKFSAHCTRRSLDPIVYTRIATAILGGRGDSYHWLSLLPAAAGRHLTRRLFGISLRRMEAVLRFAKTNFDVIVATDGRTALQILRDCEPLDLVVTDFMIPELNGTELTRAIKANSKLFDTPVGHSALFGRSPGGLILCHRVVCPCANPAASRFLSRPKPGASERAFSS